MTQQFTASKVRSAIGALEARDMEYEAGMLRAFADLLEAWEGAEAIGFLSAGALAALVDCRSDDYNGTVDLWMRSNDAVKATIPVYTRPSPSDAERLAEALKLQIVKWRGSHRLDCNEGERAVMNSCAFEIESILQALATCDAHSAQAQPPAARVTDAMVNAAMRADFCGHNVADALMCGTDWNTEVMRAALEAALAAQENPNG